MFHQFYMWYCGRMGLTDKIKDIFQLMRYFCDLIKHHNTGRSFDRVHGTKDLIDTIFVKAIRIFLFHYDILQIFQKLLVFK